MTGLYGREPFNPYNTRFDFALEDLHRQSTLIIHYYTPHKQSASTKKRSMGSGHVIPYKPVNATQGASSFYWWVLRQTLGELL